MKKCLFCCLLIGFFTSNHVAYSQVVAEDSIRIWTSLSETLLKQNPGLSFAYAQKALEYTEKFKKVKEQPGALVQLGRTLLALNKPDSAKIHFENAIKVALLQGDSVQAGLGYNGLGVVYIMSRPNYAQALQELKEAHRLTRGDSSALVVVLNSLANLFKRNEEYDTALFLYDKVLTYSQSRGNFALASDAINNIGGVYTNQGEYALAISWLKKSVSIKKSINDWDGATRSLLNMGMCYVDIKEFDNAEQTLREALQIIERHQFKFLEVLCHHTIASLYFEQRNLELALKHAHKSEDLCNLYQTVLFKQRIYELLSELYEAANEPAKSLFYNKKLSATIDSIALSERKAMLAAQDRESALLPGIIEKKRGYFPWILSSLLIAGLVSLVVFLKRKSKPAVGFEKNADPAPAEVREFLPENPSVDQQPEEEEEQIKSLEVIDGPGLKLLSFDEVEWFQKEEKYYYVYTNNGSQRFRIRQTLEELEALLSPSEFFRINRSVILNVHTIANYSFWENRKYILRTKSKHEFTISSTRLKELKSSLKVLNDSPSEK